MKELEQPTGLLTNPEKSGVFGASKKELAVWWNKAREGKMKFNYSDIELIILYHDNSLLEVMKLLRTYQQKIKPEDPRRAEFDNAIDDLYKAIIFRDVFQREFSTARQRNYDMEELILRLKSGDLRQYNQSCGKMYSEEEYNALEDKIQALENRIEELTKLL